MNKFERDVRLALILIYGFTLMNFLIGVAILGLTLR